MQRQESSLGASKDQSGGAIDGLQPRSISLLYNSFRLSHMCDSTYVCAFAKRTKTLELVGNYKLGQAEQTLRP